MPAVRPCSPFNPGAILAVTSAAALAAAAAAAGHGSPNEDVEVLNVGALALEVTPEQAERVRQAVSALGLQSLVARMSPAELVDAAKRAEAEARAASLRARTASARAAYEEVQRHADSLRELADLIGMVRGSHMPRSAEAPLVAGDVVMLHRAAQRPHYGVAPGVRYVVEAVRGGAAALRPLRADGRRAASKELSVTLKAITVLTAMRVGDEPLLAVDRGAKDVT
jgi:hypothetical protein